MRFLHIADLHFGKSLGGLSLIESSDQTEWVARFLDKVDELKPDAVVIAGDVYDRSNPSSDAVKLLNHLITSLHRAGTEVLLIAGNHDSGVRISVAQDLLENQHVHVAGEVTKEIRRVTLNDAHGPVNFWLLPYFFPAAVAQVLGDESIRDYDEAAAKLLAAQAMDPGERNVLIAHQNVLTDGAEVERGGSETMVGGVGKIDVHAFDAFDYVALGHIHAAHSIGRDTVRYAGSPLCYHFDEAKHPEKGCLLVTMEEKGSVTVEPIHIEPLHHLVELKGSLGEILTGIRQLRGEYLRCVLKDSYITSDVTGPIRAEAESRSCTVLEFGYEMTIMGGPGVVPYSPQPQLSMEDLFCSFYHRATDSEPDRLDMELILKAAEYAKADAGSTQKARNDANDKAADALLALTKKLEATK